MKKTLLIVAYSLLTVFGLLQFLLAAQVLPANPLIAVVFALAGVGILVGLFLRRALILITGLALAIAGPLAVGLTGIEPFDIMHHIVRVILVAAMVTLLFVTGWQRRSAVPA